MATLTAAEVHNLTLSIARNALIYPVDPVTIARTATAIAFIESTFNPDAKNKSSSASGLMQITKATQKDVEKLLKLRPDTQRQKIFAPSYNILLGMNRLAYQLRRYRGDYNKAIVAYNQGSYNTRAAGQAYLKHWASAYKKFNWPAIEAQVGYPNA